MTSRRPRLFIVVAALMVWTTAPTAPAQAAGAAEFDCYGTFPLWPAAVHTGGSCSGGATGAFNNGSLICAFCDFRMTVDTYQVTCVANEPPLVAAWEGELVVSNSTGVARADYQATLGYGANVAIVTSSPTGVGYAVMRPAIPLPSCGSPGLLRYQLAGTLVLS